MEIESEDNLIIILAEGKEESYPLLKDIIEKCNLFINDLHKKKQKTLEDFKEIIFNIETSSEFNYYFLKFLKENNITYKEDGQKWNFKINFEMLKETLTDKDYNSLQKISYRANPLEEIQSILKEYLNIYKKQIQDIKDKRKNKKEIKRMNLRANKREKRLNRKDKRKNKLHTTNITDGNIENKYCYNDITKKYQLEFQKLNFPLVTGIERLRVKYYRDLILEKDITNNCGSMEKYIMNMEKDKDIFNDSLNNITFNSKTFLLILTLTKTFEGVNDYCVPTFCKNIMLNLEPL